MSSDELWTDHWRNLRIHDEHCSAHTTRFPEGTTSLWKNVVWMLEDTQPGGCRDIVNTMVVVPPKTQRDFMQKCSAAFEPLGWKYAAKVKNFGLPYESHAGSGLLVGQLYENYDIDELNRNALNVYGLEFVGQHASALVFSFDLTAKTAPRVFRLIRNELWPKDSDLQAFIRFHSDSGFREESAS